MAHFGMVIDLKRCVGCQACTIACKVENGTRPGLFWTHVVQKEQGKYPNVSRFYLPVLCMHCAQAPCADVCPTGATYQRLDGIVAVDYDKCIGCKYCMTACPYGARSFAEPTQGYFPGKQWTPYEKAAYASHQDGVVEKCNFCVSRLAQGKLPACVQTCLTGARQFGDLDDPNSVVSKLLVKKHGAVLLPELGTNPSVYYLPA